MRRQDRESPIDELRELRRQNAELRAELARLRGSRASARTKSNEAPPVPVQRVELILESATGYAIFTMDAEGLLSSWNEGARPIHGWSEDEVLGRHSRLIYTPEDQESGVPEEEMRVAAARGSAENERWHVRRDGSRFFATGLLMPLRDGSGGFVKILRDHTEQLHAERNQLRRLEQMKALADAARTIMGAIDLPTTLDAITVAARNIVGAHQAICSTTRGADWSQAITAVSLSDKYAGWRSYDKLPDGSGIYAWICEGDRTVRMTQAELEAHPRWRAFGEHAGEHPPMRGWLASVLVGHDGRNLGLIQLSDKIEGEFDEVDEAIVVQPAQFAASAIERTQAGEELRQSEERLRGAFAISTVGVLFWGKGFGLMETNDAFLRMTGFSREEAIGKTWQELTPEEFHPASWRAVEQVTTLGEAAPYEKQYSRKDGSRWWGLFAPRKVGGEVVEFVLDITDRRNAEQGLRESEARFRAAVDAVQGVLWTNNARGEMVGEQPGWAALTGQTYEEYQGFGWAKAVHPDDAETSVAAWTEAVRERRPFVYEHHVRRHDGVWRLFSIRAVPAFDASGEIREWVGVHTDITELRARENELRELNATLEQRVCQAIAERDRTWNNSQDLLLVLDTRGILHATNPAWSTLLGWTPEELAGRHYLDLVHPEGPRRGPRRPGVRLARPAVEFRPPEPAPGRQLPLDCLGRRSGGRSRLRQRPRRDGGAAQGGGSDNSPGGPAAGAEDGSHRPAHGRGGARLQQPAHDHPLVRGLPAPS